MIWQSIKACGINHFMQIEWHDTRHLKWCACNYKNNKGSLAGKILYIHPLNTCWNIKFIVYYISSWSTGEYVISFLSFFHWKGIFMWYFVKYSILKFQILKHNTFIYVLLLMMTKQLNLEHIHGLMQERRWHTNPTICVNPSWSCLRATWSDDIQSLPFLSLNTVWCHYNKVNFLQNPHNRHPVRVTYGVSFLSLKSDLCSAAAIKML